MADPPSSSLRRSPQEWSYVSRMVFSASLLGTISGVALCCLGVGQLGGLQVLGHLHPFQASIIAVSSAFVSGASFATAIGTIFYIRFQKPCNPSNECLVQEDMEREKGPELKESNSSKESKKEETSEEFKKRINWKGYCDGHFLRRAVNFEIPSTVSQYLGPANYYFCIESQARLEKKTLYDKLKAFIDSNNNDLPYVVIVFKQGVNALSVDCKDYKNALKPLEEQYKIKIELISLRYIGGDEQVIHEPNEKEKEGLVRLKEELFSDNAEAQVNQEPNENEKEGSECLNQELFSDNKDLDKS